MKKNLKKNLEKNLLNLDNILSNIINKYYNMFNIGNYSKQNIIAKTSLNTKTDKIEKLSKTPLFPSSALG